MHSRGFHSASSVVQHSFSAVMHFAGLKAVGESVEQPLRYYRVNLTASMNLMEVSSMSHNQLPFSLHNSVFILLYAQLYLHNSSPLFAEFTTSATACTVSYQSIHISCHSLSPNVFF